jgi:TPR repeat protein
MYRLGLCLGAGRIVAQDVDAARQWLTRAREKGVREAADALAMLK